VTNWLVAVYNAPGEICSQNNPALNACVGPLQRDVAGVHGSSVAFNAGTPGVWTVTSVPEPETYAMLIAGLGVLGFVARRKK
jgi:hypothetical protein